MDEQAKDEVLAAYSAYVAAFRANDVQAIDKLMQYPLAHIGNDQTTLLDAYRIKPAEMRATKQWHDTKDIAYEVVFASADKANTILLPDRSLPRRINRQHQEAAIDVHSKSPPDRSLVV